MTQQYTEVDEHQNQHKDQRKGLVLILSKARLILRKFYCNSYKQLGSYEENEVIPKKDRNSLPWVQEGYLLSFFLQILSKEGDFCPLSYKFSLKKGDLCPPSYKFFLVLRNSSFSSLLQPCLINLPYFTKFFLILRNSTLITQILPYSQITYLILRNSSLFQENLPYSLKFFLVLRNSTLF